MLNLELKDSIYDKRNNINRYNSHKVNNIILIVAEYNIRQYESDVVA
jgi:tryptophan synthase beta subunit